MKNKEGTWEDIQLNMVRARKSFLLEARVERPSFFMSSRCEGSCLFTKDSAAGIVEEGLQPGSLGRGAPKPDNVAVVKERENVRWKEEKKRLRKKPRETDGEEQC